MDDFLWLSVADDTDNATVGKVLVGFLIGKLEEPASVQIPEWCEILKVALVRFSVFITILNLIVNLFAVQAE